MKQADCATQIGDQCGEMQIYWLEFIITMVNYQLRLRAFLRSNAESKPDLLFLVAFGRRNDK
jgi:hypothetical protein